VAIEWQEKDGHTPKSHVRSRKLRAQQCQKPGGPEKEGTDALLYYA